MSRVLLLAKGPSTSTLEASGVAGPTAVARRVTAGAPATAVESHSIEKAPSSLRVAVPMFWKVTPFSAYSKRTLVTLDPPSAVRRTVVFWPSFLPEMFVVGWTRSTALAPSPVVRGSAEAEEARNGRPVTARAATAVVASPRLMPLLLFMEVPFKGFAQPNEVASAVDTDASRRHRGGWRSSSPCQARETLRSTRAFARVVVARLNVRNKP